MREPGADVLVLSGGEDDVTISVISVGGRSVCAQRGWQRCTHRIWVRARSWRGCQSKGQLEMGARNTYMSLEQDGPHGGGCVSRMIWRCGLGDGCGRWRIIGRRRFS